MKKIRVNGKEIEFDEKGVIPLNDAELEGVQGGEIIEGHLGGMKTVPCWWANCGCGLIRGWFYDYNELTNLVNEHYRLFLYAAHDLTIQRYDFPVLGP